MNWDRRRSEARLWIEVGREYRPQPQRSSHRHSALHVHPQGYSDTMRQLKHHEQKLLRKVRSPPRSR